jgi:type IV secretory pathway component VirB8
MTTPKANKDYAASIKQGDDNTNLTQEDILREHNRIDINLRNEILESNRQDRLERKRFANKIFWLLIVFLGATMAVVALSGCCVLSLSDTVIVALLTTTSANVIGIFVFVVKYLFKASSSKYY